MEKRDSNTSNNGTPNQEENTQENPKKQLVPRQKSFDG